MYIVRLPVVTMYSYPYFSNNGSVLIRQLSDWIWSTENELSKIQETGKVGY
jgi:hypothetical protein